MLFSIFLNFHKDGGGGVKMAARGHNFPLGDGTLKLRRIQEAILERAIHNV